MRSHADLVGRLRAYEGVEYIYHDYGYIAWHLSTGENVEILFIEVKEKGHGFGTALVKEMCQRITPYTSVFVFRLVSNTSAGFFYRALGFKETVIPHLYKDQGAVLGVIPFSTLRKNLGLL